jgi:uncharacterized repeat protein (TIGR01451 family)
MKWTRIALPMALAGLLLAAPATAGAAGGPDLSVSISDAPDPVAPGHDIAYTITLRNDGNAAATNVSLKDTLPPGTTMGTFSSPGGWAITTPAGNGTGTVTATKSSLAAGAQAVFTLIVHVDPSTAAGTTISDHVSASTTGDTLARNNGATTTTTVQRAEVGVSLADGPDPVGPGRDLQYATLFVNHGKLAADNVTVATQVPPGTTFVSANAPAGWTITAPPVGGSGQVTFKTASTPAQDGFWLVLDVHVDPSAAEGDIISNFVSASTSTPETDTTDNASSSQTLVSSKADIAVALGQPPATVDPGTDLTYKLNVANKAPGDANDVSLTANIPPGTSFASITQTFGAAMTCTPGATAVTCTAPSLAQNQVAAFDLVLHVNPDAAGTKLDETLSASTSSPELDTTNNSDTGSTQVTGSPPGTGQPPGTGTPGTTSNADLALAATRSGKKLKRTVTYKVRNKGTATASGARLRVTLPKKLTVAEKPTACSVKKRVVRCPLGDLAPGAIAKVKLVLKAKKHGKFKVKAQALCNVPDANAANDVRRFTLRLR